MTDTLMKKNYLRLLQNNKALKLRNINKNNLYPKWSKMSDLHGDFCSQNRRVAITPHSRVRLTLTPRLIYTFLRQRRRTNLLLILHWCERSDLNRHDSYYRKILSLLRMPISPLSHFVWVFLYPNVLYYILSFFDFVYTFNKFLRFFINSSSELTCFVSSGFATTIFLAFCSFLSCSFLSIRCCLRIMLHILP